MAKSILVVEDNPDNMQLVSWILEDEGYDLACFESAEEGLAAMSTSRFDLVLMDISLPGIDGKEATVRIKSDPRFKEIPVIALTAHAVKGEHEAIIASGVDDLVTKPLDEELLIEKIGDYLL